LEFELIIKETELKGAYVIDLEKKEDLRGFFARFFCEREFEQYGLEPHIAQMSMALNLKKGTFRGIHFQRPPQQENKIVRCTRGAVYDVIIDLRKNSATYRQSFGVELTADNYRMIYIPKDFGHGYVTLEDDTELMYSMSQCYTPGAEDGIRFNDPGFLIKWPADISIKIVSERDKSWPDYCHDTH